MMLGATGLPGTGRVRPLRKATFQSIETPPLCCTGCDHNCQGPHGGILEPVSQMQVSGDVPELSEIAPKLGQRSRDANSHRARARAESRAGSARHSSQRGAQRAAASSQWCLEATAAADAHAGSFRTGHDSHTHFARSVSVGARGGSRTSIVHHRAIGTCRLAHTFARSRVNACGSELRGVGPEPNSLDCSAWTTNEVCRLQSRRGALVRADPRAGQLHGGAPAHESHLEGRLRRMVNGRAMRHCDPALIPVRTLRCAQCTAFAARACLCHPGDVCRPRVPDRLPCARPSPPTPPHHPRWPPASRWASSPPSWSVSMWRALPAPSPSQTSCRAALCACDSSRPLLANASVCCPPDRPAT